MVDVLDEVAEPFALGLAGLINEGFAVHGDRDRPVVVLNAQDWLVVVQLRRRAVVRLDDHVWRHGNGRVGQAGQADVLGREAGQRHGYDP